MPTLHCPAQHGDVSCRLRQAGLLLELVAEGHRDIWWAYKQWPGGPGLLPLNDFSVISALQLSRGPWVLAYSPTLIFPPPHLSVTPNVLSPIPIFI